MKRSTPPAPSHDHPQRALREFSQSLPMALLRAREAVMQTFRPTLRLHDVTDQQWRVIRVLAEAKEMEVLELATTSFIQASSLSRILPSLEARKLCSRRAVPTDLRKALISLTDEGRALVAELGSKFEEAYAFIAESYGAENLQRLLAMSLELEAILQAARGETPATRKSAATSDKSEK